MHFNFLVLVACLGCVNAMYDYFQPEYEPPKECPHGCAHWADLAKDGNLRNQSAVDAKFASGKVPPDASNTCAMPRNDPGTDGSWCYCRNTNDSSWGYCVPSIHPVPEQINLQVASTDTLVVSFVTFEDLPSQPPFALLGLKPDLSDAVRFTGETRIYVETGSLHRTYAMSFVEFSHLKPATTYYYRVASGSTEKTPIWSPILNFTSLYGSQDKPITRFAIFGDMGVYPYNNMDRLLTDLVSDRIDFIVHLGDHAYNIAQDDGRRGDGYLNAFQPVLTRIPWLPVLGNHEYYDGDEFHRFLNQTFGVTFGDVHSWHPHHHLNSFLGIGTAFGMARSSKSMTSRYFSADVGFVHFVALDLNAYYFDSEAKFVVPMLSWLEKDLEAAAANRHNVPWIVVGSHFPLYCSSITLPDGGSSLWEYNYDKENGEEVGTFRGCTGTGIVPVEISRKMLEPFFVKYNVDIYFAGHEHDYESIFPVLHDNITNTCDPGSTTPGNCTFTNPQGVVHIVTGAGGAPALDKFGDPGPFTRLQLSEWGYGRVEATRDTFTYSHVLNSNYTVYDVVTVVKSH